METRGAPRGCAFAATYVARISILAVLREPIIFLPFSYKLEGNSERVGDITVPSSYPRLKCLVRMSWRECRDLDIFGAFT